MEIKKGRVYYFAIGRQPCVVTGFDPDGKVVIRTYSGHNVSVLPSNLSKATWFLARMMGRSINE